jgi:hypothetical protein
LDWLPKHRQGFDFFEKVEPIEVGVNLGPNEPHCAMASVKRLMTVFFDCPILIDTIFLDGK